MEEPFMPNDERNLETMPDGALGLIPLESCKELGLKVCLLYTSRLVSAFADTDIIFFRKGIHDIKSRIMACMLILPARIPQTYDQKHRYLLFFALLPAILRRITTAAAASCS